MAGVFNLKFQSENSRYTIQLYWRYCFNNAGCALPEEAAFKYRDSFCYKT